MSGRRKTTTSNFGVGARESHDASPFYDRFRPPQLSDDDHVPAPEPVDEPFVHGDARRMDRIASGSVALVVTSPPYFAGKQYEEELEREGVPSSYLEYLEMLTDVFAECVRTLEPGGRIAVNVANLGRKPYRSLSADVTRILEHDLGLLLRGELIWQKGEGASGSCAWGSFRSAANPVLRDITERVIVASKGRFDRARTPRQRAADGLPHESTVMTDDFLAMTLDIWRIASESATRVGHPAPFPVELPEQLIRLYTFRDDLVLDPFMGSGSALVAAARLGRRYIGYDLDANYVEFARRRVAEALSAVPPESRATARRKGGAQARRTGSRRRRVHDRGAIHPDPHAPASPSTSSPPTRTGRRGTSTCAVRSPAPAAGCCSPTRCGSRWAGPTPSAAPGAALLWCCSPATCPGARARVTRRCEQPVQRPSSMPSTCCPPRAWNGCSVMPRVGSRTTRSQGSGPRRSSNDPTDPRSVVDVRTPTSSQQPKFAFMLHRGRPRPA